MAIVDGNFTNWIKIQDRFFNKVLKKEQRIFPELTPLTTRGMDGGYLEPRREEAKINYQEALFNASRSMIRFKKPHRLIKMIDKIMKEKMGVTHSTILIYDKVGKSYILVDGKGGGRKKIPQGSSRLDPKSPLIELFRNRRENYFFENSVVDFNRLNWILESGQLLSKDVYLHNRLRATLEEMKLLDAKICVPCFFKKELVGLLILGKKASGRSFIREEMNLFATLANDIAMALANAGLIESLQKKINEVEHLYEKEHRLFMNTAVALARAIDAHDIYTHGHTERVTKYCLSIASKLDNTKELGSDKRFKELLHITALLHDIGKIGIPDKILNKKGRLNGAELKIVKRHPDIGASIIFPIRELNEIAMCIRSHQEWYNGKGYPGGLKKEEIPLIARIVSVADAFDAMTSDRPYRKRRSAKEAIEEIKKYSGTQFDPRVVDVFLEAYKNGGINTIEASQDRQ